MCGISGVYSTRPAPKDALANSIAAIAHRGPDDRGFFKSEFCSLGMCRLAIIDVQDGQQPNYNGNGEIVSVFNGEIYNFREIRKKLEKKGYVINCSGDSALIPYLYQEYGLDFVDHLQGMFAIAIYDDRKQRLVLVRDRLGKKPLWYWQNKDELFFSSELKGLLALGVPKSFNHSILTEYLQFGYINAPRSPYNGVKQLEPAHILLFSQGKISVQEYWNASRVKQISISFEEAKHEAISLLQGAVSSRMNSERPVGAF